jgi:hypothetical protein
MEKNYIYLVSAILTAACNNVKCIKDLFHFKNIQFEGVAYIQANMLHGQYIK